MNRIIGTASWNGFRLTLELRPQDLRAGVAVKGKRLVVALPGLAAHVEAVTAGVPDRRPYRLQGRNFFVEPHGFRRNN